MDKVKILRLIDEADDIVSALYRQGANKDYKCKSLREKLKAITVEITAPPKSNGDLIRQMTNEEIASILELRDCYGDGYRCPGWKQDHNCNCKECFLMWLKQEVNKDVGCNS